jgi:hypothetical protein
MRCCSEDYEARTRVNGFERPWTNDQLVSWAAEPSAAAVFYLWVSAFTDGATRISLLAVFSVLLALHLVCWVQCSVVDPSRNQGMAWPCMREAQKETRYCASCQKYIPGLDHHCTWLNTCIGKAQYPYFFGLVVIGTAMFWLEFCVFVALFFPGGLRSAWVEVKAAEVLGSLTTYYVLLALSTAFVASLACGLSVLFAFHMFLQVKGMGTYAWFIHQREVEQRRSKLPPREPWWARLVGAAGCAKAKPARQEQPAAQPVPLNQEEQQQPLKVDASESASESQVDVGEERGEQIVQGTTLGTEMQGRADGHPNGNGAAPGGGDVPDTRLASV